MRRPTGSSARILALGTMLCVGSGLRAQVAERATEATPGPAPEDEGKPLEHREGIGLALSGGAYRAALFHMGALRRLNELGILQQIDRVSSVSGGSIASAHFANYLSVHGIRSLDRRIEESEWEEGVAKPFRALVTNDLRTRPLLKRLLPWNWFKASVEVDELATEMERRLTAIKLTQLPEHPDFVFDATDLAFGVNWEFRRWRVGDYQAGYVEPPPADWPLARAVAASNCFPPLFQPLRVPFKPDQFKGGYAVKNPEYPLAIADVRLTDGGNYDNFGLEPIWKDRKIVLVSDGGGTFDFEPDKALIWRIQRYPAILENQARSLHKRWLYASFRSGEMRGAYWRIPNVRSTYLKGDTAGYSLDLAVNFLVKIRTDLNGFSEAEAKVLENHGYLVADAALHRFLPDLVPGEWPPLRPPHPDWLPPQRNECQIKVALFKDYRCSAEGPARRAGEPAVDESRGDSPSEARP